MCNEEVYSEHITVEQKQEKSMKMAQWRLLEQWLVEMCSTQCLNTKMTKNMTDID